MATNQDYYFTPKPKVVDFLIVNCVFSFVALLVVVGRVLCRLKLRSGLWWDDGLTIVALPLCIIQVVMQGMLTILGAGYPVTEPNINLPLFLKIIFISIEIYIVSLTLIKLSILFVYLRLFRTRKTVLAIKISIGVMVAWGVGNLAHHTFVCIPVRAHWDVFNTPPGSCADRLTAMRVLIITNIVTDFIIMILPMHSVWNLKIRLMDKIGVASCFAIGIVVMLTAVFRFIYTEIVDIEANVTATVPEAAFIANFEPILSVICFSLPMLRPLFSRVKVKAIKSRTTSRAGDSTTRTKSTARGMSEISTAA